MTVQHKKKWAEFNWEDKRMTHFHLSNTSSARIPTLTTSIANHRTPCRRLSEAKQHVILLLTGGRGESGSSEHGIQTVKHYKNEPMQKGCSWKDGVEGGSLVRWFSRYQPFLTVRTPLTPSTHPPTSTWAFIKTIHNKKELTHFLSFFVCLGFW